MNTLDNDLELGELVTSLNSLAHREVVREVNVEGSFSNADSLIPYNNAGEVEWSQAMVSSGPIDPTSESGQEKRNRIASDFEKFVTLGSVSSNDRLTFISDDYYSRGLSCELEFGMNVLDNWLVLPHAIFILFEDLNALHYISFARSSYVFVRK